MWPSPPVETGIFWPRKANNFIRPTPQVRKNVLRRTSRKNNVPACGRVLSCVRGTLVPPTNRSDFSCWPTHGSSVCGVKDRPAMPGLPFGRDDGQVRRELQAFGVVKADRGTFTNGDKQFTWDYPIGDSEAIR